RNDASEDVFR
ncbi:hypothetical protein A2U01_0103597, partial [Trifolium medium]|nr:hypothetical protein [Trifolium medium]